MTAIFETISDAVYRFLPTEEKILGVLSQVKTAHLVLSLPDGRTVEYGDTSLPAVTVTVHDQKFFRRIAMRLDIGLGESYMDKDWDCDNMVGLFKIMVDLMHKNSLFTKENGLLEVAKSLKGYIMLPVRRVWKNTPKISHENVKAHYDLGNNFYQLMLDRRTMAYTCALFMNPNDSLEQAQLNKMNLVISKANIKKTDVVLELGCGWGGFALYCAAKTGCKILSVNLSAEQIKYAQERCKEQGLEDRVTFKQMDYRSAEGSFDKIVSIGMMEHVGHHDLGTFFELCDRLLKPDGILVIHMITMLDQIYPMYINEVDFIKQYIFPGCCIPSVTALLNAMTTKSRFVAQHIENIGPNYAKTLAEWRKNFTTNIEAISALGYDEKFQRMWMFYLTYCEASFALNHLGLHQMVLKRPTVDSPYPLGRLQYETN